jgi:amidase
MAAAFAAGGGAMSAGPANASGGALGEIVRMEGVALAAAIRGRKVSCVEVMSAYLDHVDRINPKVNAIVALQDREALLAQARDRDAQLARGDAVGPLHGVPHAVKDLLNVKGIRSTQGSPIFRDFVPAEDALQVERLRAAGAIFIGKTNSPEFGLGSHTYNMVYGATRNAYEPTQSAGGSSGGAAVGLALRMLPFADGSDFGGSLRNPSGWNNVYGFRTSIGRVPTDARDAWLPSMGVPGPMARNVKDLAYLLAIMAGYDARAPLSIDAPGSIFLEEPERSVRGRRIAWCGDLGGATPCEPEVLETCRGALRAMESLGCVVEETHPEFDFEALWQALLRLRAWMQLAGLLPLYQDPARRAMLKPEAIYEVELGMKQSGQDLILASVVRTQWYQAVRRFFSRYDYIVLPTAQVFPFAIELHWPAEVAGRRMKSYHEWMKGTLLVTMSGCPSLAAPAGFSRKGLPIGIQIIAPNHHELDCLRLAFAYEAASPWSARIPPLLA